MQNDPRNPGTCLQGQDVSPKVPNPGDALVFKVPGGWTPTAPGSLAGAVGLDIIFRPGGVAGANVFTTWTTAYNEATTSQGPVHIGVDDSIAPANVDAGGWDLGGRIFLDSASPAGNAVLNVPAGAQLQNSPGGNLLTLRVTSSALLPSLFWSGPARTFTMTGGFQIVNNASTGPLSVVGTVAAPCTLQLYADQAGFISMALGSEMFQLPAGSSLFATMEQTTIVPRNAFLNGTGTAFIAPVGAASDTPAANANFTGTLIVNPGSGPFLEHVRHVTDAGAGVTYNIDANYLAGAGGADGAIWVAPRTGTVTTLNLPDARLPMNLGRFIPIVDSNGGTEGSPVHLVAPAPNPINGVVGGTVLLSSAWAQWYVRSDGVQWDVVQAARADGVSFLTQTAWFIDPQNTSGLASDSNTGLTALTPLRTIAELTRRLGTTSPDFGIASFTTVVTFLSITNATDPSEFTPRQGTMVFVLPLTQVQVGTFNAFTPRNQATAAKATGGTASFASWVPFVNMIVQDTTTASWFWVEADTGGGTATFTQPAIDSRSNAGVVLPTLVTPLAGDAFTIWQPGIFHVSTMGSLTPNGNVIIQNAQITPVVPNGTAAFFGGTLLQQCIAATAYVTAGNQLEGNGPGSATGENGRYESTNCVYFKGCDMLDPILYGGSVWAPFVLRPDFLQCIYGGGIYFNAAAGIQSLSAGPKQQIGDCGFFCSALNIGGAGNGRQGNLVIDTGTDAVPGSVAAAWGATAWPIHSGTVHMCKTSFTAELKVTGAITLAGLTTASSFNPATGAFSPQTGGGSVGPLTAAAIDAAGPGIAVQGGGVFAPGNFCGMFKEF